MMDNSMELENQELFRRRTGNKEKWNDLSKYFWDKKSEEILGRDLISWGKVIGYYAAFYTGLLIIFLICMLFFSLALDEISPTMTSTTSPLHDVPGMSFRPAPDFETTMIRFIQGKPFTYKPYTDHIQAVLDQYENEKQVGENFIDCTYGKPPESINKVCRFNLNQLGGNCTWQRDYGYDEGQPCILLKLNKIYNWRPDIYSNTSELPESVQSRYQDNHIGVSCRGRYPLDDENIGDITYKPEGGFSGYFYPFLNQEGFRSPLVMVQFNNPNNGILINVVCEVWARNIVPYKHIEDNLGVVTFSLLVD